MCPLTTILLLILNEEDWRPYVLQLRVLHDFLSGYKHGQGGSTANSIMHYGAKFLNFIDFIM